MRSIAQCLVFIWSIFDEDLRKKLFTFPFPVTLTDLIFAPLGTLVQRYVSSELEVSTTFLFREIQRHGTDRVQHLMRPLKEGCKINQLSDVLNSDILAQIKYIWNDFIL